MTQNGHLLELVDVNQIYTSGRRQFTAIENVNLTLDEGEFVALLGPSGCGKSTLLRIITGLQRPTTGRVLYRGRELQDVNPWATIVFQTFALFPWLTVERNVLVALDARGVPADEARPKALALLDKVGLDGFETAYPRELSGGMRQKVGFARAMAVEPELLCLDEPFSALDVLSAESLRGELLELWTSGAIPTKAILMVTHSIEEAVFMADRIVVMDKEPGRVVASIRVDLPHPRQRKDGRFLSLVDRVYGILAGQTQPEQVELGTAPGELGPKRILPDVDVNELAGLLELLNDRPAHRADIYQLVDELRIDSDRLLRLTETAELLGFAAISQGDILLTPLGEAFAEASILARKEIFATRIRRLPLFRWLMNMLRAAENGRLNASVVQTALEFDLPSEDARRQIDTAIDWGRYAEILAYDDDTQTIYREMIAA
jgi:NitT/TauT family transport system ATP-binding protein